MHEKPKRRFLISKDVKIHFCFQSTVESFLAAPTLARFNGLGDQKAQLFLDHVTVHLYSQVSLIVIIIAFLLFLFLAPSDCKTRRRV